MMASNVECVLSNWKLIVLQIEGEAAGAAVCRPGDLCSRDASAAPLPIGLWGCRLRCALVCVWQAQACRAVGGVWDCFAGGAPIG